jgi:glycosyltransferase involved in cell wall biosynthesis
MIKKLSSEPNNAGCAPFFSIIIPVLNRETFLPSCVASVQSQIYGDYEIIIIDNGSTDSSYALAISLAQDDSRIKVLSEPRKGLSFARNRGILAAIGKWLILLDSDNQLFDKLTLSKLSSVVNNKPEIVGLLANSVDQHGRAISGGNFTDEAVSLKRYLTHFGELAHVVSSDWFKRNLYPEIEGAITEFPWLVWIPMVQTKKVHWISLPIIRYSTDTAGSICNRATSVNRSRELTRYYCQILKKHSLKILFSRPSVAVNCFLKLLLYARAAGGSDKGGVLLTSAEKALSKIIFFMSPSVARTVIDKLKEKNGT